jgi:hypothetical protein
MSAWWWVAIGLVAWLGVALAMSLLLSPFFRNSSQTRESLDAQIAGALAGRQQRSGSGPAKFALPETPATVGQGAEENPRR